MTEHDRTSSKPKSSFAAELSGNPGDGGNPAEDSAVTFTEKIRADNMPRMAKSTGFCDQRSHEMPEGFDFPSLLQNLQSSTY